MKLYGYLALSVFAASCTLHGQQDAREAALVKKIWNAPTGAIKEIPGEKAANMFENHRTNSNVRKAPKLIAEFDREELIRLLTSSDQPTVRLFLGAYTADEGERKRNTPTILLQVSHSPQPTSKAAAAALTYKYFEPNTLCPPPTPCGLEE